MSTPLRFAIISTPRSGNTWLLHVLARLTGGPPVAVYNPSDLDWPALPSPCVLQVHWHPTAAFLGLLEQHGFRVVVLARHPLDVLISILHFALHEPTARWLEGEAGNERPVYGAMPCSTAFQDYAAGKRTAALLSVTPEWWLRPDSHRLRYEDMVADAHTVVQRLVDGLAFTPAVSVADALEATTIPKMRVATDNNPHFWQGKTGLWKKLLTAEVAGRVARTHADVFANLGYEVDADPSLTPAEADENWLKLVWSDLSEELQNVRRNRRAMAELQAKFQSSQAELAASYVQASELQVRTAQEAAVRQARLLALEAANRDLAAEVAELRRQLQPFDGLTPNSVRMAHKLRGMASRHPHASSFVKRIFRIAG